MTGIRSTRGRLPDGRAHGRARTVAVVAAGLRTPSSTTTLATRLADATVARLGDDGIPVRVATVELRPYAKDLAEALVDGVASRPVQRAVETVTGADALIAVTPTFAASYAGLFKSFFDVLEPDALTGMPTLLGATGGSARHSLVIEYALRPLLNYFRARIVPTGVFAASADLADDDARLAARIRRAGAELAALTLSSRHGAGSDPFGPGAAAAGLPGDAARPAR